MVKYGPSIEVTLQTHRRCPQVPGTEATRQLLAPHYQRLIVWYPPLPPGHKILKGYMEALEEEYKGGAHQVEDWTMIWLDTVPESEFEDAGTTKEFFKKWLDTTETMVAEKTITPKEMKGHWGLNEPAPAQVQRGETFADSPHRMQAWL